MYLHISQGNRNFSWYRYNKRAGKHSLGVGKRNLEIAISPLCFARSKCNRQHQRNSLYPARIFRRNRPRSLRTELCRVAAISFQNGGLVASCSQLLLCLNAIHHPEHLLVSRQKITAKQYSGLIKHAVIYDSVTCKQFFPTGCFAVLDIPTPHTRRFDSPSVSE